MDNVSIQRKQSMHYIECWASRGQQKGGRGRSALRLTGHIEGAGHCAQRLAKASG